MKVLVAHGSPEVADSLLPLMQGVPTVELLSPTEDAVATLESIRVHDPEVLIVNACMPGAKETDLLQTIRAEKPYATMVILTNLTYPEFRKRLDVWEDFITMDVSYRAASPAELDALSQQKCEIWIKFSCGELGLLHLPNDVAFDVVVTTL